MKEVMLLTCLLTFGWLKGQVTGEKPEKPALIDPQLKEKLHPCPEELRLGKAGLVDIQSLDSTIKIDLKYSTTDNFLKKDVYGCLNRCYLQPKPARQLARASQLLKQQHPHLRLLVYDGVRSRRAQQALWDALQLPEGQKHLYVAQPARGSIHNYGCAVDLTLATADGKPLDMGTPYDYFGELAYPTREEEMLKAGKLTSRQLENRKLLRSVMQQAGFSPILTEWWHFNALSLKKAQAAYRLVE
jgi:D-alanyl-D-alanine dipeptidase